MALSLSLSILAYVSLLLIDKMPAKTLKICKVTPPPGSPAYICLPLTFFDLLWLRYSPPEMLFFYELPLPEQLISSSVLPKLEQSLSQTLQHFLPVSGNIIWPSSSPRPVIYYRKGDGVLLTIVVTDADFHHLTGKETRDCRNFLPLAGRIVGSDSQVPVLALKVTIFPNKGICIGFTSHHGVLDAKSIALFMKSWASVSKFGENKTVLLDPTLAPVFNRTLVREKFAELENSYIQILKRKDVAQGSLETRKFDSVLDNVRGTFTLSGVDVRKLKDREHDKVPYLSTFTVTYAYVTLCIVRAKELTHDKRVFVGFPVDIRSRLQPQLPANYFGNCVIFCDAMLNREELMGREGMRVVVNFIAETIKSLEYGIPKKIEQSLSNAFKERNPNDIDATWVSVISSSKFGFQHMDFGWGTPKKVDCTLVDKTSAINFTGLEDGGMEIELSLNKHEMERFSYEFYQGLEKMTKHTVAAL